MNDPRGRPGLDAEHGAEPSLDPGSLSEGVSSSLSELERKLRLLESELASVSSRGDAESHAAPVSDRGAAETHATPVGDGGAAGVPTPPAGETYAPTPPDTASAWEAGATEGGGGRAPGARPEEGLTVPLQDLELLLRFRDQLERYSRALVTDYGRLLTHLGIEVPPLKSGPGAARAAPWDVGGPSAGSGVSEASASERAAEAGSADEAGAGEAISGDTVDEAPNEYTGRGAVFEDVLLEDGVLLEAGPVAGLAELRTLEDQLAELAGVQTRVRAYEGGRVVFDLRLKESMRLVTELRTVLRREFLVLDAAPGRLSIVLGAADHGS